MLVFCSLLREEKKITNSMLNIYIFFLGGGGYKTLQIFFIAIVTYVLEMLK
jgi:hypothetical protein